MTWVRVDEEFARHPKVIEAGPLGMAMQVAALCYCNQYLTDGFVPEAVVPALINLDGLGMRIWKGEMVGGGEDASWELVMEDVLNAGLWKKVTGGYRIHDYDKYQPSKAQVLALREARKEAGRKGGKVSSRAKSKQVIEQEIEQTISNGSSETEAKSNPVPVPVPVLGSSNVDVGSNGAVADAGEKQLLEDLFGDTDWSFAQCEGGRKEPGRAIAWIESAKTKNGLQARWGWAWKQFLAGGWPREPDRDINTITVRYEHECPCCGLGLKTERGLDDHVHVIHPEFEEAKAS